MMYYRKAYGLPERYFLSLGRMVEKKNLATLVSAYAKFCDEWRVTSDERGPGGVASPPQAEGTGDRGQSEAVTRDKQLATRYSVPALVFVGSGELEGALREQARALGLRVVDRTDWKVGQKRQETQGRRDEETDDCKLTTDDSVENDRGAVYFYGFRQIEENPVFYALAEAFVLPSLKEEWGLVVNEAMACSLPVIVSRTAGCAEDLLPGSESWQCSVGSVQSREERKTDDCKLSTDDALEERSNGFVFEPSSVDALSEALWRVADQKTKRLIDQETNGITEMGQRSREIVAKFSCENFARQALRAAEAAGA